MNYNIELKEYEGPMDLLLDLINQNKIDIYDIPIALLTDQFLEYISTMESLNIELSSEFLVMASTLLEIKSKMLIPKAPVEEEEAQVDPRMELVDRILEYNRFKELSEELKKGESFASQLFFKKGEDLTVLADDIEDFITYDVQKLNATINRLIARYSRANLVEESTELAREEYSMEHGSSIIKRMFTDREEFYFSEMLYVGMDKSEIISIFLSTLELSKNRFLSIVQLNNYEDILLRRMN